VALSRGRHPKGYPHVDPNEDAVLAVGGAGGALVAALDAHDGADAASAALRALVAPAVGLCGPEEVSETDVTASLRAAREGVAKALHGLERPRSRSRTALSIALVRGSRLLHATYGDTSVALVRRGRGRLLSGTGDWLGPDTPTPRVATARLKDGDQVVVVSDGISDFLGAGWLADVASAVSTQDPQEACLSLLTLAGDRGAGDNLAIAVLNPARTAPPADRDAPEPEGGEA
jgi:serine/threonine protein phosphatase PrpC